MTLDFSFLICLLVLLPLLVIALLSFFSKIKFPHHQFRRKEKIYFCRKCESVFSVRNERITNGCSICGQKNSFFEEIL